MAQVFVAIGSNVDASMRMQQAAAALRARFADARFSHCYRNPAFGFEGEDFLNAVVGFSTSLSIDELLQQLREIETRCGRGVADPKWGPRAMDLDLLLYDDVIGSGPGYTLPRRDLQQRVYMLGPLAELASARVYPGSARTIGEIWADFPQAQHTMTRTEMDLGAGR